MTVFKKSSKTVKSALPDYLISGADEHEKLFAKACKSANIEIIQKALNNDWAMSSFALGTKHCLEEIENIKHSDKLRLEKHIAAAQLIFNFVAHKKSLALAEIQELTPKIEKLSKSPAEVAYNPNRSKQNLFTSHYIEREKQQEIDYETNYYFSRVFTCASTRLSPTEVNNWFEILKEKNIPLDFSAQTYFRAVLNNLDIERLKQCLDPNFLDPSNIELKYSSIMSILFRHLNPDNYPKKKEIILFFLEHTRMRGLLREYLENEILHVDNQSELYKKITQETREAIKSLDEKELFNSVLSKPLTHTQENQPALAPNTGPHTGFKNKI